MRALPVSGGRNRHEKVTLWARSPLGRVGALRLGGTVLGVEVDGGGPLRGLDNGGRRALHLYRKHDGLAHRRLHRLRPGRHAHRRVLGGHAARRRGAQHENNDSDSDGHEFLVPFCSSGGRWIGGTVYVEGTDARAARRYGVWKRNHQSFSTVVVF